MHARTYARKLTRLILLITFDVETCHVVYHILKRIESGVVITSQQSVNIDSHVDVNEIPGCLGNAEIVGSFSWKKCVSHKSIFKNAILMFSRDIQH